MWIIRVHNFFTLWVLIQNLFYKMLLLICLPIFLIALCFYSKTSKKTIKGRHVIITGGSSGIGLKVAKHCLLQGANVTLLARDETKLNDANEILLKFKNSSNDEIFGKVQIFSVDVSGPTSKLADIVRKAEESFGPVYMLVNNAGFSRAAKFEDLSEDIVRNMMEVNFMGSFFLTQEAIRSMKKAADGGIVVFVSSQGGLFGIFGFTAYAAAKGALVKFAEALHMEVKPYDISVTVSYPPDTDTPGFVEENKTKPVETKLISESAGLFEPDDVAKALVNDALKGKFSSSVGMEGFMLTTLCGGMGPVTDILSFSSQVFLSGVFRIVSVFYLRSFDRVVLNAKRDT